MPNNPSNLFGSKVRGKQVVNPYNGGFDDGTTVSFSDIFTNTENIGFILVFDNLEDLKGYSTHESHQKFVQSGEGYVVGMLPQPFGILFSWLIYGLDSDRVVFDIEVD